MWLSSPCLSQCPELYQDNVNQVANELKRTWYKSDNADVQLHVI